MPTKGMVWLMLAASAGVVALPVQQACAGDATQPVRYLDMHSHFLDQTRVPADREIAQFRQAGIAAVVIMDPDADLLQSVTRRYPGFVIPFISVARTPASAGLRLDAGTADAMKRLLDAGAVCGLGEMPTRIVPRSDPDDAAALLSPDRRKIYELAAARRVPLVVHLELSSPEVIEAFGRMAREYPRMPLILAHAGWSAGPEVIADLLAAHPNLYVDLSVRLDPLNGWGSPPLPAHTGPNPLSLLNVRGALRYEWRRLIGRHPDRFMFAMDVTSTGTADRQEHIAELLDVARKAFDVLPLKSQEMIAHANFETLVRGCPARPRAGGRT